jgi:ribonuclease HII
MRKKFDSSQIPPCPDLLFEIELWKHGYNRVAGIDEAGRGAWAGPVHAAAVVLPDDENVAVTLSGVNDSKRLTPLERTDYAVLIKRLAFAWHIGSSSHGEIDSLGIVPATILAMKRALDGLALQPQHLLVDYVVITNCYLPQTPLVKGDARSLSIAAASILAKTARDEEMTTLSALYPGYGFEKHKGYGTAFHRKQLAALGPSEIHRASYKPVRSSPQLTFENH